MKRLIFFPLIAALLLSLCGCFVGLYTFEEFDNSHYSLSFDIHESGSEASWQEDYSKRPEISNQESGLPSDMPEIATLTELRDYLNGKKLQGETELAFRYTGNLYDVDGDTIARILATCCITWRCDNGNEYRIVIYEYPGDRIARAYLSGDTSALGADERATLAEAEKIVSAARAQSDSEYELELLLHDAVAQRVSYINPSTDVPDAENPPRHLTAVGALLDKKANCQGYADAFYLLATMAGFTVGRMNVFNSDGWHLVNTVLLEDKWYVVDVTFDDTVVYSDGVQPSYRLFNAGRDMCIEYEWGAEMEYFPIADKSDSNYFYFNDAENTVFDYPKSFRSIDALAKSIVDGYLNGKGNEYQTMLIGKSLDWTALDNALQSANASNANMLYTIWAYSNGRDTFYLVKFN